MDEFVTQWKQVIPLLPPNEIKKLEDILKQAQSQHAAKEAEAAATSAGGDISSWKLNVNTQADGNDLRDCDDQNNDDSTIDKLLAIDGSTSSHHSNSSTSYGAANPQLSPSDSASHNGTDKYCDEAVRRAKRRERNRLAAAMCRKRRQDHISLLQVKVNKMKMATSELNNKITDILKEKETLVNILQEHACLHNCDKGRDDLSDNSLLLPIVSNNVMVEASENCHAKSNKEQFDPHEENITVTKMETSH